MYQIGLFARINHITAKTLRHWDEIGLLKPDLVDHQNGYRYYSAGRISDVHKIIFLKQMGLSLSDIDRIVNGGEPAEPFLSERERELKEVIYESGLQLSKIQSYRETVRADVFAGYEPVVKPLPGCTVASLRRVINSYDDFFTIYPEMGKQMEADGAVCEIPEYCFTIFHDGGYRSEEIDVEICEAVVRPCRGSDTVVYKKVPPVKRALCVFHRGPYSTLGSAYAFAFNYMEENSLKPSLPPRESYIDGIWNYSDESKWLTELQIPLEA